MELNSKISRRELVRSGLVAGGSIYGAQFVLACGGSVGKGGGSAKSSGKPLSEQELRTIGLSVTVQDRILADFKKQSGVGRTKGVSSTFPDAQTKILSGGARDFDVWETIGERIPPVQQAGKIVAIEAKRLKNWQSIRPLFVDPPPEQQPRFAPDRTIATQIWDDKEKTKLLMVPTVFNFDSIGFIPDVVEAEEANTWTSIFDKKWKGKSVLNTDPLIALPEVFMAMNTLGELDVKNPGNPSNQEVDEAIKFLVSRKKEGQFRSLWGDFGELVNLLASKEAVIADAWQPAVMAVKAEGTDVRYAVPKEGYRAWAIGPSVIAGTPNLDAAIAYADYWLSGPPAIAVSEQGYYSPTTTIKDAMPKEKYEFWYEGKPWVGKTERGIKEGDVRDGGSLEERSQKIGVWHQFPDNYDYVVQRWDEFLSA